MRALICFGHVLERPRSVRRCCRPPAPKISRSATTASPPTACPTRSRWRRSSSGAGRQRDRHHLVAGRRHVDPQHAGRRRRLWRGQSRRDRGRDPAGRRPQDRQRQRAHGRGIRLGGEAGLADQDRQGPQGQEDRLHQSALDQPGAGDPAAAGGRAEADRRRAGEDRRLRRRRRRARYRRDRRGADGRAGVVEVQGQVPRRGAPRATCCRRSTTWSASPPARPPRAAAISSAR